MLHRQASAVQKKKHRLKLLRRWAADVRALHSEHDKLQQTLARATDFQQAVAVLLGKGPDPTRTDAQLLVLLRNRLAAAL